MRTFAELLTEYTARTGVSDAELARAVGVQRQTIFRWKEGLVARPRAPEDVLRCAAKLRLTPQERDLLLMTAGFPPEAPPAPPAELPLAPAAEPVPETTEPLAGASVAATGGRLSNRRRVTLVAAVAALLLVAAGLAGWWAWRSARYPTATPGERLAVVGQFTNYTGGSRGYNVAERVQGALQRELDAARLSGVRAVIWPDAIPDEAAAQAVVQRAGASLVIWGEYDSGRVLARFALSSAAVGTAEPRWERLLTSPDDLSAVINADLPEEARYLALLTLGQLYAGEGDHARARAILTQALARPPADPAALASLYFLLGFVQQSARPPDLDAAIEAYTHALRLRPGLLSASYNRAGAYLRRGAPGDLEGALADLDRVIEALPDDAAAYVNRGAAFLKLNRPGDLERAVVDCDRAVALAPAMAEAYFNRGLANVRLDRRAGWQDDLAKTLALDADHTGAHAALCWAHGLEAEWAVALSFCDRAVALDPTGAGRDSRAVVLAGLGRFPEAASDLTAYLATNPAAVGRAARVAWLAELQAGRNPFDAAALARLRQE